MAMRIQLVKERGYSQFLGPTGCWEDDEEELALEHVLVQAQTALAAGLRIRTEVVLHPEVTADELLHELKLQTVEASAQNDLVRAKDLAELAMDIVNSYMHTRKLV